MGVNMKKILGLDIGITSVGWGIIDDNYNVIDKGVRLFDEADSNDNVKRRSYRSQRRLLRRRTERLHAMKKLLETEGYLGKDFEYLPNPYEIKVKGLVSTLSRQEFSTIMLHYAKRRGSSLEIAEDDQSEKGTKAILSRSTLELHKYKYVSQVQINRYKENASIRGIDNVFKMKHYVQEIEAILDYQKISQVLKEKIIKIITRKRHYSEGPGNRYSPSPYGRYRTVEGDLKNEILDFLASNNHLPFKKERFTVTYKNDNYTILKSGHIINYKPLNLINLMRGYCSLYIDQLRAPKLSFSAELHNLLNDLNNIIINQSSERKITKEEKLKIIEVILNKGDFSPKGVKGLAKLLDLSVDDLSGLRLKGDNFIVTEFVGFKKIRKAMNDYIFDLKDIDLLDQIAEILTKTQIVDERIEELSKIINNKEHLVSLANITGFNGYHSFSLKAISELNHEMIETNLNQQQIITNSQRVSHQCNQLKLSDDAPISPVAKRSFREALKVVSELLKLHPEIERIVIETTRSKNSKDEIDRIKKIQKDNLESKEKAEDFLINAGYNHIDLKGQIILKLRLYEEQFGKCVYTNQPIDIKRLIEDPESYEIDHIIPYSISLDDSFSNKVLVVPTANQIKGNLTPYQMFTTKNLPSIFLTKNYESYEASIRRNPHFKKTGKEKNLLFTKAIDKYENLDEFINRNLIDTSYAIRLLMNTLKSYFDHHEKNVSVMTIKGKQTNIYRKIAIHELNKRKNNPTFKNPLVKNRDDYKHHAIDALIIAALSKQKSIYNAFGYYMNHKHFIDNNTGEILFTDPRRNPELIVFLKKLGQIKSEDVKFSWKIDTKPNRSLTDDTIYSTRLIDDTHYVVKKYKDIYSMTSVELEKIFDHQEKRSKLLIYRNDEKTYQHIYDIYQAYKFEKLPFDAYRKDHGYVKKYSKKGNGPEIISLKYIEDKLGNYLDISQKYQSRKKKIVKLQVSPYRIDIYQNSNGLYKFITIRYNDVQINKTNYHINESWYIESLKSKNIDDDYKFIFSLYRNSVVNFIKKVKDQLDSQILRFITVYNDRENRLEFKPIDHKNEKRITIGISSSILKINKIDVSCTGLKQKSGKEALKLKW